MSDIDSLFDGDSELSSPVAETKGILETSNGYGPAHSMRESPAVPGICALRTAPPIPGLFFCSKLRLPPEPAEEIMSIISRMYFQDTGADQVMLFAREPSATSSAPGLPPVLMGLLATLSELLKPYLPTDTYDLLFPAPAKQTMARQAILNLYLPGEGITPHVDLPHRYADGIVGVSLGSGCVMRFGRLDLETVGSTADVSEGEQERWDLYLPPRSVIVLTGEARYGWTHGIDRLMEDLVEYEAGSGVGPRTGAVVEGAHQEKRSIWLARNVRLSVTFRWLLPGADVVGIPDDDEGHKSDT